MAVIVPLLIGCIKMLFVFSKSNITKVLLHSCLGDQNFDLGKHKVIIGANIHCNTQFY